MITPSIFPCGECSPTVEPPFIDDPQDPEENGGYWKLF
jgi:hypothetical protein